MNWLKSKKIVITHDGNFHPDDVFATALISIVCGERIKVIRSRDYSIYNQADFVLDTGDKYDPENNWFDHHQEGNAGFRENGISYSTFGLVWKKYGEQVCGSKRIAEILDGKLVQVIDADDCGKGTFNSKIENLEPVLMVDVIYSMLPTWKEGDNKVDQAFLKAVDFAKNFLLREIKILTDKFEAETLVEDIYKKTEDKRVIVFEGDSLPKTLLLKYPEPLFVVYKNRGREMWRTKIIEKAEGTIEPRKNFPKSWWGKRDSDFVKASGVKDALFCRNGGIFAGALSKEGAIKLAQLALAEANNK